MFDIGETHPGLRCEVCDGRDHCLSRWEDDGGPAARGPSPAGDSEGTHEDRDLPPAGRRHPAHRGPVGGRAGARPRRPPLNTVVPRP
jgi:hypothetical protein